MAVRDVWVNGHTIQIGGLHPEVPEPHSTLSTASDTTAAIVENEASEAVEPEDDADLEDDKPIYSVGEGIETVPVPREFLDDLLSVINDVALMAQSLKTDGGREIRSFVKAARNRAKRARR